MERTKKASRNIFFGIIEKIINMILPFITRTVIIYKLGSLYLGLNGLFSSILQVLNLTELGFSNAIIYSLYKPYYSRDKEKVCALLNLFRKVYILIGIIIFVLGLILMSFLNHLISGNYPNNINIYFVYLIQLLGVVVTYTIFSYKSVLLNVSERNDILSNVNTILNLLKNLIQILLIFIYKNYYLYLIVVPIINILNNLICSKIVDKKFKEYKPKGEISITEKKIIKKSVLGILLQKICYQVRNSFDTIFLSMFLGLNVVAIYSNYYSIFWAVTVFINVIISSISSIIGNSVASNDVDKNYDDIMKLNFIYLWISGVSTVCLLCLYQPFMKLWLGEKYMLDFLSVILFCVYFYSLKIGDIRQSYFEASGLWYEGKYIPLLQTLVNII